MAHSAALTPAAPAAVQSRAQALLEALARPPSGHPASGGYGTRRRRLGLRAADLYGVARDITPAYRRLEPRQAVRVAQALVDGGTLEGGILAYALLDRHRGAAESLTARDLPRLARNPDDWATADCFAGLVSGPAWRRGQIPDSLIVRWTRSRDRWWRRIALVSTVPLNRVSRGGTGDVPRTLRVCRLLVADRDDMVVKALSWALREVAKRDPAAARRFLERHRAGLAARVVREVTNKLTTGRKNPAAKRRAPATRARSRGGAIAARGRRVRGKAPARRASRRKRRP